MNQKRTILVLGGARSGKSRYALELAKPFSRKTIIATLEPKDEEMKARIENHKRERGPGWRLIEEPIKLAEALEQALAGTDAVVVDCVTLWISNLVLAEKTENEIVAELEKLCGMAASAAIPLIIVSNEVGQGIVPGDPLSRRFRDLQGKANQMMTEVASEVYLMVAGIGLRIKEGK